MFGASAGDDRGDPGRPDLLAVLVVVVAPVRVEPVGASADPPAPTTHWRDDLDQGHELGDVVAVAAGQRDGERDAVRFGIPLRTFMSRHSKG